MYQSQINIRYAKSLFLLGEEKGIIEELEKDINIIYQAFNEIESLNILLEHPIIKSSKKKAVLNELFDKKINKYTMSFLDLIIKNKREKHLKNICRNFIDIYRKHKGIKKAVLTTAYKLTEEEEATIIKSIEDKFVATIELQECVDENIIGGMIIQVDDKQLDLSVAKQINKLRKDFLNIDFNNKKKK